MDIPPAIGPIERIIARYDAAKALRDQWQSNMQDCYTYAIPDRDLFTATAAGQKKGAELFDSTAVAGVQEFASRIQSSICPPWRQWSKLIPGAGLPKQYRESDELALYLEEQTDILFDYINHSNFALKSHEAFQDLAVGTGALTVELNEQQNGLVFDSVPPPQLGIEEGPTGMIETQFIDRCMKPVDIERLYPGAQLPEKWNKLKATKPAEKVEFCVASIFEPKKREYHLVVFSKTEKAVMYWRPLGETSPMIVFRWLALPGETWGRGPVMAALPDIKTVNKVVEFTLRGAALGLSPTFTAVNDGALNPYTVQVAPDAIIPVMSNDQANPTLRQLVVDSRPDLTQIVLEDLRRNIKRHLLNDTRRQEGPIQSATEILVEQRDFVQLSGSGFGRVQTEFIERVLGRCVALLRSIGKMADFKVDGREVTLKHLSPLARAQDQEELLSLQTAMASIAPFGPEAVMLAFKTDKIGEWIAKKAGVDASVLRTDGERDQMQKQLAAAAAAAAQQQGAPATA